MNLQEIWTLLVLKMYFEILYKLVKSLNISCIFATHNNDLAKLMDRKIILKNGSIYNE